MQMKAAQQQRYDAPGETNYETDEKEILPTHKLKPPLAPAAWGHLTPRRAEALARAALPVPGFREFARAGACTAGSHGAAQRSAERRPASHHDKTVQPPESAKGPDGLHPTARHSPTQCGSPPDRPPGSRGAP